MLSHMVLFCKPNRKIDQASLTIALWGLATVSKHYEMEKRKKAHGERVCELM